MFFQIVANQEPTWLVNGDFIPLIPPHLGILARPVQPDPPSWWEMSSWKTVNPEKIRNTVYREIGQQENSFAQRPFGFHFKVTKDQRRTVNATFCLERPDWLVFSAWQQAMFLLSMAVKSRGIRLICFIFLLHTAQFFLIIFWFLTD